MTASVLLRPMTADELARWSVQSVAFFAREQVDAGLAPEADAHRDAERIFAEQVPDGLDSPDQHFLRVVADGEPVGDVWLRVRQRSTEVEGYLFDVAVLPAARGRGLGRATMLAVHDHARSLGATVMRLNVFGHNGPALALYTSLGYTVSGATMQRDLDETVPPAGPSPVVLHDMTPAEYAVFRPRLEEDYAANIAASGAMPVEEARAKSVEDLDRLLPEGLASSGHRLWTAYDGTEAVGTIWVHLQHRPGGLHAFGYELEVREDLRRRGYGRALIEAAFRACQDLGVRSVGLSVFGFNDGARRLYDELGFRLTAQGMVLPL